MGTIIGIDLGTLCIELGSSCVDLGLLDLDRFFNSASARFGFSVDGLTADRCALSFDRAATLVDFVLGLSELRSVVVYLGASFLNVARERVELRTRFLDAGELSALVGLCSLDLVPQLCQLLLAGE